MQPRVLSLDTVLVPQVARSWIGLPEGGCRELGSCRRDSFGERTGMMQSDPNVFSKHEVGTIFDKYILLLCVG